jgi:hypothetical protein
MAKFALAADNVEMDGWKGPDNQGGRRVIPGIVGHMRPQGMRQSGKTLDFRAEVQVFQLLINAILRNPPVPFWDHRGSFSCLFLPLFADIWRPSQNGRDLRSCRLQSPVSSF